MKGRPEALLVGLALLCGMADPSRPPPSLGFAASFAVLGGAAVNAGASTITGNLGVSPGKAITGSPVVKLGAAFRDDALARQAQKDSAAAYNDLAARTCTTDSSTTLAQGVYCLSSLAGTLTLDARGNPDAFWIFQSATTLTTAADSAVRVINGGFAGNVFWQVGDSATVGARTALVGNILARNDITLEGGASLSGRALAQTGVVTLKDNDVSLCCNPITLVPARLVDGKVCVPFGPAAITASGGSGSYDFSVAPETLPSGLALSLDGVLSGTPAKVSETNFTVTARDKVTGCVGSQVYKIGVTCDLPFTFSPATLPDGTVDVEYPTTPISVSDGSCVKGPLKFSASDDLASIDLFIPGGVLQGTPSKAGGFKFTVTAVDPVSGCAGTHEYTIKICAAIAISPPTLPCAIADKDYPEDHPLATIMAGGGTGPYTFSPVPFSPAPGLMLTQETPTTAVIWGKPTKTGNFPFTITATDVGARGCSVTRDYILCVGPCPTITLHPSTLPDAVPDVPYPETTITAPVPGNNYRFEVVLGTLPAGLSLHPTPPTTSPTATISGTPTNEAVSAKFTVRATDEHSCFGDQTYTICLPITILPETLPSATAGVQYTATLTASGGAGPDYTFGPANLPCGLKLDPNTGVISGTPSIAATASAAGNVTPSMPPTPRCTFTVTAVDKITGCKGTRTYALRVTCPPIAISPSALPNGSVGSPYNQPITAIGGTAPYVFRVASGSLPPGLTLAANGTLSGAPTTTGPYCFAIAAADASGCTGGPRAYTIVISAATCPAGTAIIVSPPTLPFATTGMPYAQMMTASGGTSPYTFSVLSGALPPGLMLNPATGLVSGAPTSSGTFNLTIAATDANGCLGTTGCSITMSVDIPALSGWGMALLSMLLGILGLAAMRRST